MSDTEEQFKPNYDIGERKIRVAISSVCNLNCTYCDQGRRRSKDKPGAMEDFRSTEIRSGSINTEQYIRSMHSLYHAGYSGVTFTGGEPLLNPDWPEIVKNTKHIGFKQVQLTTNAMLLKKYVDTRGPLPKELNLLTISLDTFDRDDFSNITKGNLDKVLEGIKSVKESNPNLPIKANKVVMRSNLPKLKEYIDLCEKTGAINRLTLLNLICKDTSSEEEKSFFDEQFVPPQEIMEILSDYEFRLDDKNEYLATTENGLLINLMDTNKTLRSEACEQCPIYCQEGFFTARVATDGTIRTCPDFNNQLPYIKSTELDDENLNIEVYKLLNPQRNAEIQSTLGKFCIKHGLNPKRLS